MELIPRRDWQQTLSRKYELRGVCAVSKMKKLADVVMAKNDDVWWETGKLIPGDR